MDVAVRGHLSLNPNVIIINTQTTDVQRCPWMCSVVRRQVTADITTTIMTHRQVPVVPKTRTRTVSPIDLWGPLHLCPRFPLAAITAFPPSYHPPSPPPASDQTGGSLLGPISVCSVLLTATLPSVKYLPQWSTVDVELTSPLPKLRASKRSLFERHAGTGHDIALHAWPAARNWSFHFLFLPGWVVQSTSPIPWCSSKRKWNE